MVWRFLARAVGRLAVRLAALAVMAGLLVGVPAGLVTFVGSPLPDHVPTWAEVGTLLTADLTDTMIANVFVGLVWLVWAAFAWSTVVETAAFLAHAKAPRLPVISPVQGLAAALVAAIVAGVLASGVRAAAATTPTVAVPARPAVVAVALADPAGPAQATPTVAAHADPGPAVAVRAYVGDGRPVLVHAGEDTFTYTVAKGDTMWTIAAAWLGDPHRWPEICQLNLHEHFPTVGGTLTDCDLIYPNWVLELPPDATPPPGARPLTPDRPDTTKPAPTAPASPGPTPGTSPSVSPTASAPSTDPDGVAPDPTAAAPTAPSTPDSPDRPASDQPPAVQPTAPPGVGLPGGGWVDLGLAAAIAAAAALVWIHRARRRPPSLDAPDPTDPDLRPLPAVVGVARRGLARHLDPDDTDPDPADPADAGISPSPAPPDGAAPQPTTVPAEPASSPALGRPLSAVWPPAGVGLTGPGALAAARGFLVSALTAGADDPDQRGRVVVPAATLATLLGTAAVDVADTPRLTVAADLDAALSTLEAETLRRTRILFDHEVDTVTALRAAGPGLDPLPAILLLADVPTGHAAARVAALLTQGQRLDLHGVLLGGWPAGTSLTVAADGATTRDPGEARHGAHVADIGRFAVLDPASTADLLRTLHEAHTGQPAPPAPAEHPRPRPPGRGPTAAHRRAGTALADPPRTHPTPPRQAPPPGRRPPSAPDDTEAPPPHGDAGRPAVVTDLGGPAPTSDTDVAVGGTDVDEDEDDGADADHADHAGADDGDTAPAAGTGLARVCVLGPPQVAEAGPPAGTVTRKRSLELLVYLALHRDGARASAIRADLLADVPRSQANTALWTTVSALRALLRRGGAGGDTVLRDQRAYRLNPDAVTIDLWQLQDALADAKHAPDEPSRVAALRRAVAAYTGPLADGRGYDWIEGHRETIRNQALAAHLHLAQALATTDPDAALTVVGSAIGHDPYAEPAYRLAMRIHAHRGDRDAIGALRHALIRRLAGIDTKPDPRTLTLADQLLADLDRRP